MGTKTWGNWSKERNLGSGSFGVVTLWKNNVDGQKIAIKLFTDEIEGSGVRVKSKNVERWAKEVQIMKHLSHPNIVKIVPIPEDLMALATKLPILCMEYCAEGDLRKVLNKPENCSGLREADVRTLMKHMKDAVEFLHKEKIMHRDIKPENIVLQSNNGEITYKLIDLGYGKELEQSKNYKSIVGTLQYVAPEISSHEYTYSVDYWSLGIVCHEVITGIRPFLPNMTPFSWFPIVKKKTFEDICVYQNADGSIEFSKELARENHLSWFLRDEVEEWLRVALEWDGRKRGRAYNNDLIIFTVLDHILEKKIVTVFSIVLFEQLSYEVDNSTAISTLMGWIERDSKHFINDQLLLLPTGEELTPESFAIKCWDETNEVAMVYVFSKSGFLLPIPEPVIPKLVTQLLEEPKRLMPYHIIKRMWANSIFFIQRQIYLCETLAEAYAVKLSILNRIDELSAMDRKIDNEIQLCSGKLKLHNASIDYNEKYFNKMLHQKEISDKKLEDWKQESTEFRDTLWKISERWKMISYYLNELRLRFDKTQSFCDESPKKVEQLKKLLNGSYVLFGNLQKMPKELRNSESNSAEMSAIVSKCLILREEITSIKDYSADLEVIKECESRVSELKPEFCSLEQELNMLSREVVKAHLFQFKDIWLLFDEYVSVKPMVEVKTVPVAQVTQISPTSSETSINNFLAMNNFPSGKAPEGQIDWAKNSSPVNLVIEKPRLDPSVKEYSLDANPEGSVNLDVKNILNNNLSFSYSTEV
ncbi:inhibitor of nuclear factor kappa-B kinase subunit alpha-like isoform X2 [Cimex lectularius]|uniref:IkappaB kinase n=1 Tax=Cimex lectularius TaxID=79782 RepID=A0A8I6RPZ6_CIMLE|nr:inhibitor of nuclear factor kappa-B kinase subunit alpha-like isoform X2 [Cimex lectularius]